MNTALQRRPKTAVVEHLTDNPPPRASPNGAPADREIRCRSTSFRGVQIGRDFISKMPADLLTALRESVRGDLPASPDGGVEPSARANAISGRVCG
jgi:hypothetical protein